MNLSLFDSDYLLDASNRYEVAHFHIYIEDDLDWPFETNSPHRKGVFMHEYIHYIQHLSTLYGISISRHHNLLFCNYKNYFSNHNIIHFPLTWTMVAPEMNDYFEAFNRIKGDREYGNQVDQIRVSEREINAAFRENRAVCLDTFNNETNQWSEKTLKFGYYAIIESMADLMQRIYEPEVNHNTVPYQVVQKLCKSYYPQVVHDNRMMIALCICALMSSNPGYGFFEIVRFAKDHPEMNGAELYREYVNSSTIRFRNGVTTTITKYFEHQFKEYGKTVEQALGVVDYYREAFDSALNCAKTGDNLLLILLYDESISSDNYFKCLADYFGSPYIEAYNQTLYPGRNKMPIDVAAAVGLELLYKGISNATNTNCPRLEQCTRMKINSYDCINGNQWNRMQQCPFKEAMHFFQIDGKTIQPDNNKCQLPIHA